MNAALSADARAFRRAIRAITRVARAVDSEMLARELLKHVSTGAIHYVEDFAGDVRQFHAALQEKRRCAECGRCLHINQRSDAMYCDDKCRVKAFRRRVTGSHREIAPPFVADTGRSAETRDTAVTEGGAS
jgi:ferredoxin